MQYVPLSHCLAIIMNHPRCIVWCAWCVVRHAWCVVWCVHGVLWGTGVHGVLWGTGVHGVLWGTGVHGVLWGTGVHGVLCTLGTHKKTASLRSEHKALLLQIQHKAMRMASVSNICDGILLCPSANKKASRHHQMCLRLVPGSHIHHSDQLFTSYQHHPKLFHTTCVSVRVIQRVERHILDSVMQLTIVTE